MELADIGFNFDEMARLAKEDPNEFTRRRDEAIRQLIQNAARIEHMERLQLDLDATRYGVTRGVQLSEQMMDKVLENTSTMNSLLARLHELVVPQKKAP